MKAFGKLKNELTCTIRLYPFVVTIKDL